MIRENYITGRIIGMAIKIHKALGPGLLESAYQTCFYYELKKSGLYVEKEKKLPLVYDDVKLESAYRIDLLVENKVLVEIKSVDRLHDIHLAQTLTYLRLGDFRLGLLMNFNVTKMAYGIKRVVNNFEDEKEFY